MSAIHLCIADGTGVQPDAVPVPPSCQPGAMPSAPAELWQEESSTNGTAEVPARSLRSSG